MRIILLVLSLSLGAAAFPAFAQETDVHSALPVVDVCIVVDESRDTLSPRDRASAILLLSTQFELAGRRVVSSDCAIRYTLSHVTLGQNIFVTLSAESFSRQGTAAGLSDLPALYSQMVRSIVTGRPMAGFNVVDRTNVTAAQASPANRVTSERYGYARLGYGGIFGDRTYATPSFGFGYRAEVDSVALDVSFMNMQMGGSSYESGAATAGSLLKLQGLWFLDPAANASAYVGGGLSWGGMAFAGRSSPYRSDRYTSGWHGSGLQGELTFGYELPRASTLRVFVEANAVLPFYKVASTTYTNARAGGTTTVARRYVPALVVSVGVGWERGRRGRP